LEKNLRTPMLIFDLAPIRILSLDLFESPSFFLMFFFKFCKKGCSWVIICIDISWLQKQDQMTDPNLISTDE
jgi:hypothetical protein